MIVDKINAYLSGKDWRLDEGVRYELEKLSGWSFQRQFMETREPKEGQALYVSAAGKCPRQNAYAFHKIETEGRELDPRSLITFYQGDVVENTVVALARLAGCNITATGFNQVHIVMEINGIEVRGYPDGLLLVNNKLHVVEVKSMSDFAFKRFEKDGEIDDMYLQQMHAEMLGTGLDRVVYVGLNKNTGVLHEKVIQRDEARIQRVLDDISLVAESTPEALPARPEWCKPDAKGFLPWMCMYCNAWKTCVGSRVDRVLVRDAYKLKVKEKSDE